MDRLYAALPDSVAVVEVGNGDASERLSVTEVRRTAPHPDASLNCVAVSPLSPDTVCCGTADHGLFLSTDAGETWRAVDGIEQDRVTAVTCARNGDESGVDWWAGTEPSRLYHSTDGETWTHRPGLTDLPSASSWAFPPRPHTHHVRWIESSPEDPKDLHVAVEAGALVRTPDGGKTWTDRVDGSRYDTHSMATHPAEPKRRYCAAGDGYAESRDGGDSWDHPQEGLPHRYCWSVVVDPSDPDHRLLSSARGPGAAHTAASAESYVYEKRGEEPWTQLSSLPTGDGVTRAVLGVGEERFYALSNAGLFTAPTDEVEEEWYDCGFSLDDDATVAGLAVVELGD